MVRTARNDAETEDFEQRIQSAIRGLDSGEFCSANAAAQAQLLNPKTLRDRWSGKRRSDKAARQSQKLLTSIQEEVLESWCMHLSCTGEPLNRQTIAPYVQALCGTLPSSSWVERFLHNNPYLVTRRSTGLDPKRAQAFNKLRVEQHFHLYHSIVTLEGIPPRNIYNMDEKGIQSGGGRRGTEEKFICGSRQKVSTKLRSSNLELSTCVECVAGDGDALDPSFVLEGLPQNMQEQWFDEPGIGSVAVSKNGWTDDELTYLWFKKVFVPQAVAQNTSGRPILLLMDGHGSHETNELVIYGHSHKPRVHVYLLPPHTTHRLQPLDVGVFGVAQRQWARLCDQRVAEGNPVSRDSVVTEWMKLRPKFMRQDIILSAWRKTGLLPFNPSIFTDEDFAPSLVSSTHGSRPVQYPNVDLECDTEDESVGEVNGKVTHMVHPGLEQVATPPNTRLHTRVLPSTIPPLPVTKADLAVPAGTDLETRQGLRDEVRRLQVIAGLAVNYSSQAQDRAARAEAHASVMALQNTKQQQKLNEKNKSKKRKRVRTDARLLTGDEEMAVRSKEAEDEQRRAEELAARNQQRERDLECQDPVVSLSFVVLK
ncbi:DDE superfamily endonuclease [Ceratobasidium sp. AG-Ba]|nr:DDE superfamily endonuclease [Ceratobasidium sp. AG-Ba]QRW06241.1 DDE superfamily endonuclease [Ceratobasidium sp. AG-Ba]